jgi:hypothetical protein
MTRMKITFNVVREIALALPDVEEDSLHGAPTVKVSGRLLACPALHKSAEANSIVVRVGVEQRASLLACSPNVYYVTDHYRNYPSVLARLDRIDRGELSELLGMGWRFVTSRVKAQKKSTRGRQAT